MVKILVLLENTTKSSDLKCKHGLSLYIETETHKILFDMGPNDLFLKNAETLGVDPRTVKYHVSNMLQKTNFENKLQLAVAAIEARLTANFPEE